MRWSASGRSQNLEDRRGGGGGGMIPGGIGGLGIGGVVLVVIFSLITKQNPLAVIGALDGGTAAPGVEAPITDPAEEEKVLFIGAALDSTQALWARLLPTMGAEYRDATLVLFRDRTTSPCGAAQSATGPFYCPGDEKVYIDLGFYQELATRFGAPGDFAEVYVLAHEIGHHVQRLLGTEEAMRRAQEQRPDQANALSVKLELQADCYAGVWAHTAAQQGRLERGDVEEGLGAASAVGDDRIQRMGGGSVNQESWTHGSSEQRMRWFKRGFESGDPKMCETFR
ncbi:MAG: neutral zinc metallopeptidase [Gemmatimonadales bacterium]|nr:neutral zinc metallopeptidase [Gemmatimonadales bacterium]MBP6571126.1 neutral zinc metallopeptidase [Gemmatimonadales bacterium]MBP7620139.1 neutral zinc metallopeptidase [Gemmatimonadales bacterium]MBP9898324.1 neutral zinc metallopeptidase [Gemmatimonadales bacterium]